MTDFSDREDRMLVQLAHKQEVQGRTRLSWALIAKQMPSTRKTPEQLRLRLAGLKNRFGKDLARIPRFVQRGKKTVRKQREQHSNRETTHCAQTKSIDSGLCESLIKLFDNENEDDDNDDANALAVPLTLVGGLSKELAAVDRVKKLCRRPKERMPLPVEQHTHQGVSGCDSLASHHIVSEVFRMVTKADVRQASGKTEHNVGELTTTGTSVLIDACRLTSADVFVDVGAGIGNVVAQVALESNVRSCVGVEIRCDLAEQGKSLIKQFSTKYPRLHAVTMYAEDICAFQIHSPPDFYLATVLFCHNTLFQPEAQMVVERLCCVLPRLRVVVLQQPFCPRHRPSCLREFCTLFRQRQSPLTVSVTFTNSQSRLVVFERSRG